MCLFYFLFWTAVTAASVKETLYGKIGDEAVLTPDSVVNPITSMEWKHGPDIAMEWFGGKTFSYRQFKDRGTLNTLTGALTITGLTRDDSGNYTAEINGKVNSKTQLLVISPVSKPTISVLCEPEMTYCVLTCSGSTTGAEPVTYNWASGHETWSSTREHKITEENEELWFSCEFQNPVSSNSSEAVFNPFINEEPLYKKISDEAALTPDSVVNPITSIEWKHGPYTAMEWYGGETFSYRQFKDRGTLNTLTGELTITGLTRDDSGNYTAEINGKVNSKTQLLVISPVSKPTISEWCAMTYCVFTCSGSTTDAEPITYWWRSGDITWPSTKEYKITMVEKELWFSWFSCEFENPVSLSSSDKLFNPFIRNQLIFMAVFFLVGFIIIIIYCRQRGIIYFIHKWRRRVLIWTSTFITVFVFFPVVFIIIIIYLINKGRKEDLTWLFNFIPICMLVGCIIIIINLIYKGIIYFRRKWRRREAADWTFREMLERRRNKRPASLVAVQETSTQDTTSTVPPEPSNETEQSAMISDDL